MKHTKAMNDDMMTSLSSHVQMGPTTSSSPVAPNGFYPAGNFRSLNSFPEMPFRTDGCPSSPKPEDFGGAAAPLAHRFSVHPIDSIFPSIVYSNLHDVIYCNQTVYHDHVINDNNLQSLRLWMSPAETRKRGSGGFSKPTVHRKSIDTFGQRTSQYRGVTRHRWTGRYEAHLWDSSCKKEGQTRKGRQVYLGGYDLEDKAARAYDLAAIKYWGPSTHINFAIESYAQELEEMKSMNRQEYVAHLRRKSSGFSRGASIYRGVTRHHHHGRWQARIGRVAGNKDLYLGTFGTQEEAAEAYDIAAVKFRGATAVTNFDISQYNVDKIMASTDLPAGSAVRTKKEMKKPSDGVVGSPSDWKMIRNNQSNGRDRLPDFGA